jgi:riboflavin biosynthesis pyrimidine reductase
MRRLLPTPGETTVDDLLDGYRPFDSPPADRPRVAANMITTLDGRASLYGRSKELGSEIDSEFLIKLRRRFDAVMIGSGTMRAERYGRIVGDPDARARRKLIGLTDDPLAVIVSGSMNLPFDAPLFTEGAGHVLIFTESPGPPPETATSLEVVRPDGPRPIAIEWVLRYLRREHGVRALLCEGGPHLLGQLETAGVVDDFFLTISPELVGGAPSPRILEGELDGRKSKVLEELLEHDGELFARYAPRR